MNLINEQSVTTSTSASSSKAEKELSPAQVRFASYSCSSMTLVEVSSTISTLNVTQSAQPSVVVSSGAGLLPLSCSSSSKRSSSLPTTSLAFSSRVCSSSSSSSSFLSSSPLSLSLPLPLPLSLSSLSSLPSVESINRQIERISNTITSSDANQINLIKKMPTNTSTTAPPVLNGKSTAGKPSDSINTPTTTTGIVTVTDVSETKPSSCSAITTTTAKALNEVPSVPSEKEREVGCEHYKRRAMFVTPCCNKFYKCRYCHDENETHHFDRKTLTELICNECNTRQQVQEQCENCGVRFGKYTCLICNLFDDEDKNQYHCDDCGICRIGGRENFFHCEVCNMCLPIELKIEGHRCVENISRSNCPVCLGAIHTSRIPCHIPECGHLLHKMCFDQLLASGHYVCPTCQTSLLDMTKMWEYLDAQALLMAVPKKYENQRVYIFCNDCHETCKTKFHFVGLKCIHCGGYNTTQDVKRRMSWVNSADSSTSA